MIEDLKPYAEYKDSGLPWLGKVPAHWEIKRNGSLFQQRNAVGEPDWPILEVSLRTGVRIRQFGSTKRKQVMSDKAKYKCATKGDFVYNMMRMWQGAAGIAPVDGLVSPAYVVAKPFPHVNPAFFTSLFRTEDYLAEIDAFSRGIVKDRNRLYWDQFKQIPTPYPSPAEQTAIVRFLDWANGRLERAIRAKRKVIALLNEQKQAIIHRAVTRGLDPSVPLKDSGIPWIGEIPMHWEVRRLKNVGATQIGLTYSPADLTDETGCLVLRASNIKNGKLISADDVFVRGMIPAKVRVKRGDILICARSGSRGLVGKSAMIPDMFDGVAFGAFMSVFRSSWNDFLFWVLNSNLFKFVMAEFETSTINQLTQGDLNNLVVPIPPRQEQLVIVAYVNEQTASLETALSRLEREITLLREYRTRLVADVVTGKLDVREAATRVPDEELLPDLAAADDEPDDLPIEEEDAV